QHGDDQCVLNSDLILGVCNRDHRQRQLEGEHEGRDKERVRRKRKLQQLDGFAVKKTAHNQRKAEDTCNEDEVVEGSVDQLADELPIDSRIGVAKTNQKVRDLPSKERQGANGSPAQGRQIDHWHKLLEPHAK